MPNIELNFIAIGIAIVACFMLCHVWFSVLFGKVFLRAIGMENEPEPTGGALFKSLGLTLLGITFSVFVLANTLAVWTPATWGLTDQPLPFYEQALSGAGFTWLGFVLPVLLNQVAWEKRAWLAFAIDGGYYFCSLLLAVVILLLV